MSRRTHKLSRGGAATLEGGTPLPFFDPDGVAFSGRMGERRYVSISWRGPVGRSGNEESAVVSNLQAGDARESERIFKAGGDIGGDT